MRRAGRLGPHAAEPVNTPASPPRADHLRHVLSCSIVDVRA
jgi:hypothetical protein